MHNSLAMIDKWEKMQIVWVVFGALVTNLSKALEWIPRDLIIVKLEEHGFHVDALKLIHTICPIESKVRGWLYFMVFRKDPYSVLYYSRYTDVTYSTFSNT